MNAIARIRQRYSFDLPQDYLRFFGIGSNVNLAEVMDDLYEVRIWFTPDQIADFVPYMTWEDNFIPFAKSYMVDHWAWVRNWETEDGIGVAHCLRSSDTATGYAPKLPLAWKEDAIHPVAPTFHTSSFCIS